MPNSDNFVHIYTTNAGKKTCTVANKHLHSKYQPEIEALRIISEQQKEKHKNANNIELVIILGAALGYEISAVATCYPKAKIFRVFFNRSLYNQASVDTSNSSVETMLYESPIDALRIHELTNKLQKAVTPFVLKNVAIVQWPPACCVWHENTKSVMTILKKVFEHALAEKNTTQFFMRQWLANAVFHYIHLDQYDTIAQKGSKPALVIGAGLTLMDYLPTLKTMQKNFMIVATSSALTCLCEHKLFPDLVVHQDSSYYASMHLSSCKYSMHGKSSTLAMPLHAGRSEAVRSAENLLLLNSQQDMESLLPMPPCTKIAAYGTVMGTALELSWQLTNNKIYIVGFDTSIELRGSHCLPHSTQNAMHSGERRTPYEQAVRAPYTTAPHVLKTQRCGMPLKQTEALRIYNKWFENWQEPRKARTYMLVPKTEGYVLSGFTPTTHVHTEALQGAQKNPQYKHVRREKYEVRRKNIAACIEQWRNMLEKNSPQIPRYFQNTLGMLSREKAEKLLQELERHLTPYCKHATSC